MGLDIVAMKGRKEVSRFWIGYGGFFCVRVNIAYVLDKEYGKRMAYRFSKDPAVVNEHHSKVYRLLDGSIVGDHDTFCYTPSDVSYFNSVFPDKSPMDVFLWHSDCDGRISASDVRGMAKVLRKADGEMFYPEWKEKTEALIKFILSATEAGCWLLFS